MSDLSRPDVPCGRVVAKSVDTARMTVTSVLTYPATDWDGDFVRPDGGDWDSRFKAHPQVSWWHEDPVGRGSVELKSIPVGDGRANVPVGVTSFFQRESDTAGLSLVTRKLGDYTPVGKLTPRQAVETAEDAFRLVEAGLAPGVSLEFDPVEMWETGRKSLRLRRPGRHYERWTALGWGHTPEPANPGAQVLSDSVGKAIRAVQTGRHPGGKPIGEIVLKSLTRWAATLPTRATVTVPRTVEKAMDELTPPGPGDPVADPVPGTEPPESTSDSPPEITEAYDGAQMLADVAQQLRDRSGKSLHAKTRKVFAKIADDIDSYAEDLIAHAEDAEGELNSGASDTAPKGDDESGGDEPPDDETPELKSLPRKLERRSDGSVVLKSAYKPKRLGLADLGSPVGVPDAAEQKAIGEALREIRDIRRSMRRPRG